MMEAKDLNPIPRDRDAEAMVERVAQALARNAALAAEGHYDEGCWPYMIDGWREEFRATARVAIEAMRELLPRDRDAEGGLRALPCIVCGQELESCSRPNQPLNGLAFSSRGHYGTTTFDPMDGSALEINVCDDCLEEAGEKRRVLHYPAQTPSSFHPTAALWGTSDD